MLLCCAIGVNFVVVPELKKEIQKCDILRERLSAGKWERFFEELDLDGEQMLLAGTAGNAL